MKKGKYPKQQEHGSNKQHLELDILDVKNSGRKR